MEKTLFFMLILQMVGHLQLIFYLLNDIENCCFRRMGLEYSEMTMLVVSFLSISRVGYSVEQLKQV